MSWRREAYRAYYRAQIGTIGASNSYVSYLNLVDYLLGGLDEKLQLMSGADVLSLLDRQPSQGFSAARSLANCRSSLKSYLLFTGTAKATPCGDTMPESTRKVSQPDLVAADVIDPDALDALLREAKDIGARYYRLTGKPLGVTGEVAEYEAAQKLGLKLAGVRTPGYDAVDPDGRRVQIKGRAVWQGDIYRGRCPGIKGDDFDLVLLVLLNRSTLDAIEIWEASGSAVRERLEVPGSRARKERGSLAISQFRSVGRRVWPAPGP